VRRNRRQGGRVLDLKASGREKPISGEVRTQRRCTRRSQDAQEVGVGVGMASGRTALSNAKSGRNVGSTSRADSRLAFGCQVRQTHRTYTTQGIIFADVIPIIGMSDQTHLRNLSGNKNAWPVYLTLGNLPTTRPNRPGSFTVLILVLLPVPPKLTKSAADHLQRGINADTLRGVFELLFEPLQNAVLEGVNIDFADGKVRRCFPKLSTWMADHMENVVLHGIKSNVCPKCKVLRGELGTDANSHRA